MLVECRELYERHIDFAALPAVEADDHSMDGEKQVMIGLLQGLGDGVEEELRPGVLHICPKGSEHSIINTGTEDLVLFTIVVAR